MSCRTPGREMIGSAGDPATDPAAAMISAASTSRSPTGPRRHLDDQSDQNHPNQRNLHLGQPVTAFRNGGWWRGTCSGVSDRRRYTVHFADTGTEIEFHSAELAWAWDKHFSPDDEEMMEPEFAVGSEVEVLRNRENYGAAWFGATVLEAIGKTRFVVEYDQLVLDDGGGFLRESVDALYMRPVKRFGVLDEVEACFHGGWSAGVVARVVSPGKYGVTLKHLGGKEVLFHCSDIRPRWEWILRAWSPVSPSSERELDADAMNGDNICMGLTGDRNRKKNKSLEEIEEQCVELNKRLKTMEGFETAENAQAEEEKEEKEEEEDSCSKKNLVWTVSMDRCLIDALIEQMLEGNKIGKNITKIAYISACDEIYVKFGKKVSVAHLKNRLKTLKKDLICFEDMEDSGTGFVFNRVTKLMDADPAVWAAYIKAHPEAKHFRHKAVPCYEKLRILFGKNQTFGQTTGVREKDLRANRDEIMSNNHDAHQETKPEFYLDSGGESINTLTKTRKIPKGSLCKPLYEMTSRREGGTFDDFKDIKNLTYGINTVASAIERCAPRETAVDQMFEEVRRVTGLDEDFQLLAYDYLCGDATRGKAFAGLPIDRRRRWLELKLNRVAK